MLTDSGRYSYANFSYGIENYRLLGLIPLYLRAKAVLYDDQQKKYPGESNADPVFR